MRSKGPKDQPLLHSHDCHNSYHSCVGMGTGRGQGWGDISSSTAASLLLHRVRTTTRTQDLPGTPPRLPLLPMTIVVTEQCFYMKNCNLYCILLLAAMLLKISSKPNLTSPMKNLRYRNLDDYTPLSFFIHSEASDIVHLRLYPCHMILVLFKYTFLYQKCKKKY